MNFVELQTVSTVGLALLKKAQAATHWKGNNGIERIDVSADDFAGDPKIHALIKHFDCEAKRKLSLFRFPPNSCHAWHTDAARKVAINMLLEGWNSITLFGRRIDPINLAGIERLTYSPDRYYMLNTAKMHTIVNFDNLRYLVSIGIPEPHTFMDVFKYIQQEGT